MNEWRSTTLDGVLADEGGSIKTGPFGTALKAAEYSARGVPVISVGEIGYGILKVRSETPRVSPETTSRLSEYLLKEGDIVFARKGSVDRSAIIRPSEAGYFLGSDGIRLRLPETVSSRFLAYQLMSDRDRRWILQHAGGSTMPSLNQKVLGAIPVVLPPLGEQRRIAEVLGALDDLIELNRKLTERLTELALTLALRPTAATLMPLADLYKVGLSGVWGEESTLGQQSERVAVLRGKDLEEIVAGTAADPPYRFLSQRQIDSRSPQVGEIWTAGSGSLGPSLPVTPDLSATVGWPTVLYSNFVKRLVPIAGSDWYGVAWAAMVRAWRTGDFAGFVTGTAMPNLDPGAMLRGIRVPALSSEERAEVNHLVNLALGPDLRQEIVDLQQARDELLPLLMSGAMRVTPKGVAA